MTFGLTSIFIGILLSFIVPVITAIMHVQNKGDENDAPDTGNLIFIGALLIVLGWIVCMVKYYG